MDNAFKDGLPVTTIPMPAQPRWAPRIAREGHSPRDAWEALSPEQRARVMRLIEGAHGAYEAAKKEPNAFD